MPPASENAPHTPTRRTSSSALLNTFRSLAGVRSKALPPSSPSPSSSLTPTQEDPSTRDDSSAVDDTANGIQSDDQEDEAGWSGIDEEGRDEHLEGTQSRGIPI